MTWLAEEVEAFRVLLAEFGERVTFDAADFDALYAAPGESVLGGSFLADGHQLQFVRADALTLAKDSRIAVRGQKFVVRDPQPEFDSQVWTAKLTKAAW